MRRRALAFSAVLFIVGFGLSERYLSQAQEAASGGESTALVVTARALPAGSVLDAKMLVERNVPASFVSARAVKAAAHTNALKRKLRDALPADEPLLWTDLEPAEDAAAVASAIPAGQRAFVMQPQVQSALIQPGDHVDVIFTPEDQSRSTTLLQAVPVLAVGNRTERGAVADKRNNRPQGVTLSVTMEQVQLLTQAEHDGTLRLSLRNPGDLVRTDGVVETRAKDVDSTNRGMSSRTGRVNHGL
jgi:pilus assembly protein CpaB